MAVQAKASHVSRPAKPVRCGPFFIETMATSNLLRLVFIAGVIFGDENGSAGFAVCGGNRQTGVGGRQTSLSPRRAAGADGGDTSFSDKDPKLADRRDSKHQHEVTDEGLKSLSRSERRRLLNRREHERRKDAWLARYGTREALQRTFGDARRDLTPKQTRALYHALLPRSLLALSELGVLDPSDLAPLAYQARIAAKEYARSRCNIQGKVMTALVDQYRSLRSGKGLLIGSSANPSMTWEDVLGKYETEIMEQERAAVENGKLSEEELMMKVFMRIIEKSCSTNQAFDGLFLNEDDDVDEDLLAISTQLEEDIQSILLSPNDAEQVMKRREKVEKQQAKEEKKLAKRRLKDLKRRDKLKRKFEKERLKCLNEESEG